MLHDFALALCALRRNPGFSLVALTTLALGPGSAQRFSAWWTVCFCSHCRITDPDRVIVLRESRLPQFPSFSVSVSSGYFSAMAVRIVRGRAIDDRDRDRRPSAWP